MATDLGAAQSLHRLGKLKEAETAYKEWLSANPEDFAGHYSLGLMYFHDRQYANAIPAFESAVRLNPGSADSLGLLGISQQFDGRRAEALKNLKRANKINPNNATVKNALANLLQRRSEHREAICLLDEAVRIRPDYAEAWHHLGISRHQLGLYDTAVVAYQRTLALVRGNPQVHYNLALSLQQVGESAAALGQLDRALELEPQHLEAAFRRLYVLAQVCQWQRLQDALVLFEQAIEGADPDKLPPLSPFVANYLPGAKKLHQLLASSYAKNVIDHVANIDLPVASRVKLRKAGPLRIGYISPDFGQHAIGQIIAGVLEHHDRDRFEIHAFALAKNSGKQAIRIRQGVSKYHALAGSSAAECAARIHEQGIQVLIDLGGYTLGSLPEVMALRPAPVQISFLGYLNSMHAPFIDYLVCDGTVIPQADSDEYAENLIRLPEPFLPATPIEQLRPGKPRSTLGLPANAFVFACFNHSSKIEPDVFAAWASILKACQHGVLWLYDGDDIAVEKALNAQARSAGIRPRQIVFAPRCSMSEHLQRMAHADLFLDTFYHNARATAQTAIQSGLPILSLRGDTMMSRITSSLNTALGLSQLIADSKDDYVKRAISLYEDRESVATMSKTCQQFWNDARIETYTRQLEQAYTSVWNTQETGNAPTDVKIQAI